MTLDLIDAATIIRQNLHRRQNFLLIENVLFKYLQSPEAEKESHLSGAKLLLIYQNLRYALPEFGFKPLHLRITGTDDQTAWQRLCTITNSSSASLAKALKFLSNKNLINRASDHGLIITFNLPQDSFRANPSDLPPTPLPPVPTSKPDISTSKNEAPIIMKENIKKTNINPPAPAGEVDVQKLISQSEKRITEQITKTLWDAVNDLYNLGLKRDAMAARVGAATAIRMMGKPTKPTENLPPRPAPKSGPEFLQETIKTHISMADDYANYPEWIKGMTAKGFNFDDNGGREVIRAMQEHYKNSGM